MILPILSYSDIVGRKSFIIENNQNGSQLKQSLYFTLDKKITSDSRFYLDYDDQNELNYESLRKIYLKFDNGISSAVIGDQTWSGKSIYSPELLNTRAISGDFQLYNNIHSEAFYESEKRKMRYLEINGDSKRGPYFIGDSEIIDESEKVYRNGILLIRNVDYTIDYKNGMIFFNNVIAAGEKIGIFYIQNTPDKINKTLGIGAVSNGSGMEIFNSYHDDINTNSVFMFKGLSIENIGNIKLDMGIQNTNEKVNKSISLSLSSEVNDKLHIDINVIGSTDDFSPISCSPYRNGLSLNAKYSSNASFQRLSISNYSKYFDGLLNTSYKSLYYSYISELLEYDFIGDVKGEYGSAINRIKLFEKNGFNYLDAFYTESDQADEYFYKIQKNLRFKHGNAFFQHYKKNGDNKTNVTEAYINKRLASSFSLNAEIKKEISNDVDEMVYKYKGRFSERKKSLSLGYLDYSSDNNRDGIFFETHFIKKMLGLDLKRVFNKDSDYNVRASLDIRNFKAYIENSRKKDINSYNGGINFHHDGIEFKSIIRLLPDTDEKDANISINSSLDENWEATFIYDRKIMTFSDDESWKMKMEYRFF